MTNIQMNESFMRWDPAQVSRFIDSFSTGDEKYGQHFLDHNIDGSLLPYLDTSNLKEMGITSLCARLKIKEACLKLVESEVSHSISQNPSASRVDPTIPQFNCTDVRFESMQLTSILLQDAIKKLQQIFRNEMLVNENIDSHQLDMRKLNENFNRLKVELIPLVKLVKESKPLPTPTLDPGYLPSLSEGTLSAEGASTASQQKNHSEESLSRSNSTQSYASKFRQSSPSAVAKRFSSGTVYSVGTGKVAHQGVAPVMVGNRHQMDNPSEEIKSEPHLIHSKSSSSIKTSNSLKPEGEHPGISSLPQSDMQPLKQLRASSDDSCLKILQHAMKRHHISRSEWSKYVLVICYGNKERILKLTEKPVIVFKELQESGKHPAIMLRQLATNSSDEDIIYEGSRIGDDIPGGTL